MGPEKFRRRLLLLRAQIAFQSSLFGYNLFTNVSAQRKLSAGTVCVCEIRRIPTYTSIIVFFYFTPILPFLSPLVWVRVVLSPFRIWRRGNIESIPSFMAAIVISTIILNFIETIPESGRLKTIF